jgi:membrane protease YdiL (CAAX protease family)
MFIDERYRLDPAHALLTAVVAVPLGTVVFEEVAFRGVLWGLIRRDRGAVTATVVSSALFGLWHIRPALQLGQANQAAGGAISRGPLAPAPLVAGVVVFTALAGAVLCELRRRSGSLLAPVGLHWAANGLGVLVSAALSRVAES